MGVQMIQEDAASSIAARKYKSQPAKAGKYLSETYGGKPSDWLKFETPAQKVPGRPYNMSVHGFVNTETGQTVNVKSVLDYAGLKSLLRPKLR